MSNNTDYLLRLSLGYINLATKIASRMTLGLVDCKDITKFKILYMYIDMLPGAWTQLTDAQLKAISIHINKLLCYRNMGYLTHDDTDVAVTVIGTPGPVAYTSTEDEFSGKLVINTIPQAVTFPRPIGTTGDSYQLLYSTYNSEGEFVSATITNRTKYGFMVSAPYDDYAIFEWNARLVDA